MGWKWNCDRDTLRCGGVLTKTGSRAKIGICGFLRQRIADAAKNVEFQQRISVPWMSNNSPRAPTSSYSGEIRTLFYGFDIDRMLKVLLSELMFGNMGVGIPTYVRNDNPDASNRVD